jgi:hypothetical protein
MSTLIYEEKKLDKTDLIHCCRLRVHALRKLIRSNILPRTDEEYVNENPFTEKLQIADSAGRDGEQRAI